MKTYEVMTIIDPGLEIEATDALLGKITAVIKKEGGKVANTDKWGRKKLAYPINDRADGVYALITFNSDSKVIAELDHFLKINDEVLRHVVVRLPESKQKK